MIYITSVPWWYTINMILYCPKMSYTMPLADNSLFQLFLLYFTYWPIDIHHNFPWENCQYKGKRGKKRSLDNSSSILWQHLVFWDLWKCWPKMGISTNIPHSVINYPIYGVAESLKMFNRRYICVNYRIIYFTLGMFWQHDHKSTLALFQKPSTRAGKNWKNLEYLKSSNVSTNMGAKEG